MFNFEYLFLREVVFKFVENYAVYILHVFIAGLNFRIFFIINLFIIVNSSKYHFEANYSIFYALEKEKYF